MQFPAGDEEVVQSPPRLPKSLRRRLLDVDFKSPSTVEEIEAKLRDADLRRQKYYEKLSDKARSKPRSSLSTSFQEEDRGLRLEAKLQAAEQKRWSILAKAQMHLARLDELRQAAKIRCEDERMKRREKVESRVQQAEANRMLMLKACRQRRASLRERYSNHCCEERSGRSMYVLQFTKSEPLLKLNALGCGKQRRGGHMLDYCR